MIHDLEVTKRIMGALVRAPPKPHDPNEARQT
jgi:hypothetical protein